MKKIFGAAFCLGLFLSFDIFAAESQSEPVKLVFDFYENDEPTEQMSLRVFTFDQERLDRLKKLKNSDQNNILFEISKRVVSFINNNNNQDLQTIYNNNIILAKQAKNNSEKIKPTEIATLIAIYDTEILMQEDFQHGLYFNFDFLSCFFLQLNFS